MIDSISKYISENNGIFIFYYYSKDDYLLNKNLLENILVDVKKTHNNFILIHNMPSFNDYDCINNKVIVISDAKFNQRKSEYISSFISNTTNGIFSIVKYRSCLSINDISNINLNKLMRNYKINNLLIA